MVTRQLLAKHGVNRKVLDLAEAKGFDLGAILKLLVQYGPTALEILEKVLGSLPKK